MWVVIAREPPPPVAYWRGRRCLAAVDAVAWPLAVAYGFVHGLRPAGIVGPVLASLATLLALRRIHRALWHNDRYRFATWFWGKIFGGLLLMGMLLKLMISA